jgi:hypothetical protein
MRSKGQTKLVHYYVKEGELIPHPGRDPFHVKEDDQGTALHIWFEEDEHD